MSTLHADDTPGAEPVRVPSGDAHVAALLHRPGGAQASTRLPAVVVGGSLTAVKEQMIGIYAGQLAQRGFAGLAIDYRNWGESGGSPRHYEDPDAKAADIVAAVGFLAAHPAVDPERIAVLGVCTSGGTALYAARRDERIRAVAAVASHLAEPAITPDLYGGAAGVDRRRRAAAAASARYEASGFNELIQAYSNVNESASHPGTNEYYMDQTRGGGVPHWHNAFSVMAWAPWLDFDPVAEAPHVTAPTLVVHTDDCALPAQARKVYDLLACTKELHWTTGAHFEFYDQSAKVGEAADAVADHLRTHLR